MFNKFEKGEKMNKKQEKSNEEIIDSYDYLAHCGAASECTGLIPSLPESKEELKSYENVYPFTPPKITPEK